jgi:hypothetical protein
MERLRSHYRFQNEKTQLLILILLWAISQTIAYFHFDMRMSVDSDRYINNAINITQGIFPEGPEIFYYSYSLIIALLHLLGVKPENVIYVHFVTAILSIICIYKLTKKINGNNIVAFIATALYIGWFKFQQWNLIVYTDAMFCHLVIVSVYVLVVAKKPSEWLSAFFLVVFTSLLRPTGVGFLFAVVAYVTYSFSSRLNFHRHAKALACTALTVGSVIFLNVVLGEFIDSFIASYSASEIIYPKITLLVEKPNSLIIPAREHQPIIRLFLFAFGNPIYFAKLSIIKGLLFLGHVKPYYSTAHNIFIVAFLYPMYFLAIKGFRLMNNHELKIFIGTFLGLQILMVSLTSENWDGRFLLPVLPVVFILSSFGISGYLNIKSPVR